MMLVHVNVGPGCSSVGVGAFSENGPFRPSGNVLVRNEYSWNKGERFLQVVVTAPKQNFWCTLAPFGWSFFSVEKGQKNCEVLISFLVPVCCSRGQRAVFGEPCRSWLLILYWSFLLSGCWWQHHRWVLIIAFFSVEFDLQANSSWGVFNFWSQRQFEVLARLVCQVPTVQGQGPVHYRGELCW